MNCPICDSTTFSRKYSISSYMNNIPDGLTRKKKEVVQINSCDKCGLELNEILLNSKENKSIYEEDSIYSNSDSYKPGNTYPKYTHDIVKIIKKFSNKNDTILEIGSFTGNLLFELKKQGIKAKGVELDPKAADVAKKRGLDIHTGDISTLEKNNKYDLILGIAIFEHIEEPLDFLADIKNHLSEKGILILQFPNKDSLNQKISKYSKHSWDMYTEPGHLFFYGKKDTKRIFKKEGYKILDLKTSTILTRGKIPILPGRNKNIESKIQTLCQNKIFNFLYQKSLSLLDFFKQGDTLIVIAQND